MRQEKNPPMNTTPRPPCGACGLFEGHDKPEECDLHPARVHEFTPEQARLLWEVVTMVDVDTLQDNLERVGAITDPDFNLEHALTQLQDELDPDGAFLAEWMSLSEREQEREQETP